MIVSIVSADFGRYHQPYPLPRQRRLRWSPARAVLVSDHPATVAGWHNTIVDLGMPPRVASKTVKCCPEKFTVADVVIWIDAQVEVRSADFVSRCLSLLGDDDVLVAEHPTRRSILAEAIAGQGPAGRGRYEGQPSVDQAHHYMKAGHPEEWGLYATGFLVRRMTDPVRELGRLWLKEQEIWSTHDQISFPYLCRKILGKHPRTVPLVNDLYRLRPRRWAES